MSIRIAALLFALPLSACAPQATPQLVPVIDHGDTTPFIVKDAKSSDQLLVDRYIVYRKASTPVPCAGTRGTPAWTVKKLFADAPPDDGPLRRYCVYLRNSSDSTTNPPPLSGSEEGSPDRVAVSGMAGGMPTNAELTATTAAQLDFIDEFKTSLDDKAWLAILDTMRTRPVGSNPLTASAFDSHGKQIGSMARRAFCDGPVADSGTQCAGWLVSRNAMAWARNSSGNLVQPPNGGSIGSQADVARAIYDEVGRWEGSLGVGDEHKLVLNLSLGWHPAYGGSETRTSMPVPVRAVYDALRYASCKDALVIAAAGHEDTPDSGSQADGPLYPAAWESEPATTSSECLTDFLTTSTPSATGTYTPLIYAVGGVDVHLNPLPISRPGSMPRIAAPGAHLASFDGSTLLKPISGTSVSTAAVSAAATVVRTIRPTLTAHEAMGFVYAGGIDTDRAVEFCPSGSCGDTAVVTVCGALEKACKGDKTCLTNLPAKGCGSLTADVLEYETTTSHTKVYPSWDADDTCGDDAFEYEGDGNDVDCPVQDQPSAAALSIVQPMPPKGLCPTCPVQPGFDDGIDQVPTLVIMNTIDDLNNYENLTISVSREGLEPYHFQLPNMSGTQVVVQLPWDAVEPGPGGEIVTGVTLDYMYTNEPFFYSNMLHLEPPAGP